jgi:hypothetical protein
MNPKMKTLIGIFTLPLIICLIYFSGDFYVDRDYMESFALMFLWIPALTFWIKSFGVNYKTKTA